MSGNCSPCRTEAWLQKLQREGEDQIGSIGNFWSSVFNLQRKLNKRGSAGNETIHWGTILRTVRWHHDEQR